MKLSDIWGSGVSFKGVVLTALISLAVGLGISASLDWLAPSRAVNFMPVTPAHRSRAHPPVCRIS